MSMSDIMQRWRIHQWEELVKMQQENCLLDATIVCGDNIHCQAHSAVLAASSKVLRQALREDLTITSDLPSSIWLIIINFIYTGELAYSEGEKFDFDMLMTTAKWLDMHTLVELIEAHSNMKNMHARANARAGYQHAGQEMQPPQQPQAQHQQQAQNPTQYIPGRPGQKNMPVFNDTKVLDLQESLDFLYDDCAVDKVQHTAMPPAANEDYDDDSQVYSDSGNVSMNQTNEPEINEPPEYRCPHCEYCTPDVAVLKTHVQTQHAGERHVFICCVCITAFPSRQQLHDHFTTHSTDPYLQQQPYCPVCSEMHITTEKLLIHMEYHKDPQKNINMGDGTNVPYCCHICDLIFGSKNALKLHLATHVPNQPYKCGVCAREFKRKSGLQDHMYSGHNGNNKPRGRGVGGRGRYVNPNSRRTERKAKEIYTCEHCGETFTKKTGYMIHRGTHYGKYPYSCKQCSFGATSMSQLEVHMKLHNLSDGQKKLQKQMQRFFCFICGLRFHRRQLFVNHYHQVHKETDDLKNRIDGADGLPDVPDEFDNDCDRYGCFHCVFHSSSLDELCEHYPKHFYDDGEVTICEEALPYTTSRRSEESFLCDTCGESFSKKLRYINHVMTHSGPEKCGDCPYEALHKWDLLKHRRKDHKSAAKQTSEEMQSRGISSKCVICGSLFGTYTRLLDHFHFDHKKFEHLNWIVKKFEIGEKTREPKPVEDEANTSKVSEQNTEDADEGSKALANIKREDADEPMETEENAEKDGETGETSAHKIKQEQNAEGDGDKNEDSTEKDGDGEKGGEGEDGKKDGEGDGEKNEGNDEKNDGEGDEENETKVSATVDSSEVSSKVRLNIKVPLNLENEGGEAAEEDDDDEEGPRTHRRIAKGRRGRKRKGKGGDLHHLNIKVPIKMPRKEGEDEDDESKEYHLNIKVPIKVAGGNKDEESEEEDEASMRRGYKRPVPRKVKKATLASIKLPEHLSDGIREHASNEIEELYNCFHCTFVSADPKDILEHYMTAGHLQNDNQEYECSVCDEVFETKEEVLAHCSECSDPEHGQLEMKLSVDKTWYHDTFDDLGEICAKKYKCWKCEEFFENPQEVVNHQRKEHVTVTGDEAIEQMERASSMAPPLPPETTKKRGHFTHFSSNYTRSFKNQEFKWPRAKDMKEAMNSPYPIARGRGRPRKKQPEVKHVQNLYQCKICGKAYMSIANIEKHCLEMHQDKEVYSSMAVDTEAQALNGESSKMETSPAKTDQANAAPTDETGGPSKEEPPKSANSKKVQLYKCKYCFLLFPTVPQVKQHVKEEHNQKKKKKESAS